tara:strand:- start:128 stop:391 length:264 start_codon:yes stop_codon:yes gene_type:complete
MENTQQEQQLSPEEIAVKKQEMLDFYRDSMVYLNAQSEYEEVLLKLDEIRFKRSQIQMQYAMMAQQMEEGAESEEEEPAKERTLKKK